MASLDSIMAARKNRNAQVTKPNLTDDIVDGIKRNQAEKTVQNKQYVQKEQKQQELQEQHNQAKNKKLQDLTKELNSESKTEKGIESADINPAKVETNVTLKIKPDEEDLEKAANDKKTIKNHIINKEAASQKDDTSKAVSRVYDSDSNENLPLKIRMLKEPINADSNKKAITLEESLTRFVKKRSKQCGVPMQYYINILISEDIVRAKIRSIDLYDECENKYKGKKERLTLSFTKENLDHITSEIEKHGITFTAFMNYIVEEEEKREALGGKRI